MELQKSWRQLNAHAYKGHFGFKTRVNQSHGEMDCHLTQGGSSWDKLNYLLTMLRVLSQWESTMKKYPLTLQQWPRAFQPSFLRSILYLVWGREGRGRRLWQALRSSWEMQPATEGQKLKGLRRTAGFLRLNEISRLNEASDVGKKRCSAYLCKTCLLSGD